MTVLDPACVPAYVVAVAWRKFLATVDVRGPIPIGFEVVHWRAPDEWLLQWTMNVPDRDTGKIQSVWFQNRLPDEPSEMVIRQCVLCAFQHEALESVVIGGERVFDPHRQHWYSNLLTNWRFAP